MFKQPQIPTLTEATLVMDSRKTMASVRHQNISGSWSQLYKSGGIYLDLSYRAAPDGSSLMGNLVADPSLQVRVGGLAILQKDAQSDLSTAISSTGAFRIPIDKPGAYRLELVLEDQIISIKELMV